MDNNEGKTVADVADAWEAVLTETEKVDPTVTRTGSKRRSAGSSNVPVDVQVGPKVRTEDVAPLVKALGTVGTRVAQVSDLSAEEVEGIAEPAAALLEILAPETPPWMIPAMTLSARLGGVVEIRRQEFVAKRPKSEADAPLTDETGPELVPPDEF